jgi:arginase
MLTVIGVIAWPGVADTTNAVRAATVAALQAGTVPVLLAGCCSVEPGAVAAAREVLGDLTLAHIDGHLDLYDGTTSPTGEAADMVGHGPAEWSRLLGEQPVLRGEDVVVVGHRDPDELADGLGELAATYDVQALPADVVRADPTAAADAVLRRGDRPVWIHLDVDVLDQAAFPATDYLLPGGLSISDLTIVLLRLAVSGRVAGFSLGCYNPDKDPDRAHGAQLSALLTRVLLTVDRAEVDD